YNLTNFPSENSADLTNILTGFENKWHLLTLKFIKNTNTTGRFTTYIDSIELYSKTWNLDGVVNNVEIQDLTINTLGNQFYMNNYDLSNNGLSLANFKFYKYDVPDNELYTKSLSIQYPITNDLLYYLPLNSSQTDTLFNGDSIYNNNQVVFEKNSAAVNLYNNQPNIKNELALFKPDSAFRFLTGVSKLPFTNSHFVEVNYSYTNVKSEPWSIKPLYQNNDHTWFEKLPDTLHTGVVQVRFSDRPNDIKEFYFPGKPYNFNYKITAYTQNGFAVPSLGRNIDENYTFDWVGQAPIGFILNRVNGIITWTNLNNVPTNVVVKVSNSYGEAYTSQVFVFASPKISYKQNYNEYLINNRILKLYPTIDSNYSTSLKFYFVDKNQALLRGITIDSLTGVISHIASSVALTDSVRVYVDNGLQNYNRDTTLVVYKFRPVLNKAILQNNFISLNGRVDNNNFSYVKLPTMNLSGNVTIEFDIKIDDDYDKNLLTLKNGDGSTLFSLLYSYNNFANVNYIELYAIGTQYSYYGLDLPDSFISKWHHIVIVKTPYFITFGIDGYGYTLDNNSDVLTFLNSKYSEELYNNVSGTNTLGADLDYIDSNYGKSIKYANFRIWKDEDSIINREKLWYKTDNIIYSLYQDPLTSGLYYNLSLTNKTNQYIKNNTPLYNEASSTIALKDSAFIISSNDSNATYSAVDSFSFVSGTLDTIGINNINLSTNTNTTNLLSNVNLNYQFVQNGNSFGLLLPRKFNVGKISFNDTLSKTQRISPIYVAGAPYNFTYSNLSQKYTGTGAIRPSVGINGDSNYVYSWVTKPQTAFKLDTITGIISWSNLKTIVDDSLKISVRNGSGTAIYTISTFNLGALRIVSNYTPVSIYSLDNFNSDSIVFNFNTNLINQNTIRFRLLTNLPGLNMVIDSLKGIISVVNYNQYASRNILVEVSNVDNSFIKDTLTWFIQYNNSYDIATIQRKYYHTRGSKNPNNNPSSYITLPNLPKIYNSSVSVEFWFKPELNTSPLIYYTVLNLGGDFFGIDLANPINLDDFFTFHSNNNYYYLSVSLNKSRNVLGDNFNFNDWHHYAVVYNDKEAELNLFVDGNSLFIGEIKLTNGFDANINYLGRYNEFYGSSGYFKNFRVWNTARTEQQIKTFKNLDINSGHASLIYSLPLSDQNGYNSNLTLNNNDSIKNFNTQPYSIKTQSANKNITNYSSSYDVDTNFQIVTGTYSNRLLSGEQIQVSYNNSPWYSVTTVPYTNYFYYNLPSSFKYGIVKIRSSLGTRNFDDIIVRSAPAVIEYPVAKTLPNTSGSIKPKLEWNIDSLYTFKAISNIPDGLNLDKNTGIVSWDNSLSQLKNDSITIVVSNIIGSDTTKFYIEVGDSIIGLSYTPSNIIGFKYGYIDSSVYPTIVRGLGINYSLQTTNPLLRIDSISGVIYANKIISLDTNYVTVTARNNFNTVILPLKLVTLISKPSSYEYTPAIVNVLQNYGTTEIGAKYNSGGLAIMFKPLRGDTNIIKINAATGTLNWSNNVVLGTHKAYFEIRNSLGADTTEFSIQVFVLNDSIQGQRLGNIKLSSNTNQSKDGDYLQLPNLNLGDSFAITVWYKLNANANNQKIFDFGYSNSNLTAIHLGIVNNNYIQVRAFSSIQFLSLPAGFNPANWNHYTISVENRIAKVYVNTVLVGSFNVTENTRLNLDANYIGRSIAGNSEPASSIDLREFRIWRKGISSNLLQSIINTSINYTPQGLYYYLNLDNIYFVENEYVANQSQLPNSAISENVQNTIVKSNNDSGVYYYRDNQNIKIFGSYQSTFNSIADSILLSVNGGSSWSKAQIDTLSNSWIANINQPNFIRGNIIVRTALGTRIFSNYTVTTAPYSLSIGNRGINILNRSDSTKINVNSINNGGKTPLIYSLFSTSNNLTNAIKVDAMSGQITVSGSNINSGYGNIRIKVGNDNAAIVRGLNTFSQLFINTEVVNGTISPRIVSNTPSNFKVTYAPLTNTGYRLDSVIVNGVLVKDSLNSYTFNNITQDNKIRVVYKKQYRISTALRSYNTPSLAPSIGTITSTHYVDSALLSDTIKFTVVNNNYFTDSVYINDVGMNNIYFKEYVFRNIIQDQNITVVMNPKSLYIIQINTVATFGGDITPSIRNAFIGDTIRITYAPNKRYALDSVYVDNKKVDSLESYTFNDIRASHFIKAYFSPITKYQIKITYADDNTEEELNTDTAISNNFKLFYIVDSGASFTLSVPTKFTTTLERIYGFYKLYYGTNTDVGKVYFTSTIKIDSINQNLDIFALYVGSILVQGNVVNGSSNTFVS
ncbi:MAG: hypothetical protein ORN85_01090, partial [Sediminibacterium sp.]|nr:hypothetical protein [Sediminibacterium sp.]